MASNLPDYVASAQSVPQANRIAWFRSTAQTYAGIMLWFVFWHEIPVGQILLEGSGYSAFRGGTLAQGLLPAVVAVVLAALICHFLFYLVPGMLGMKTGLPLYVVGTSTYGVHGGLLMPGFLMGVLQFGWLGVNAYFSAKLLASTFGQPVNGTLHMAIGVAWAVVAAVVGLKGVRYVAAVATFLPLIPLVILIILLVTTIGGVGQFDNQAVVDAGALAELVNKDGKVFKATETLDTFSVIALLCSYIVGFFATAGAAGTDFGMNNRDAKDVQLGGLVGIAGATIFTGVLALLITAGALGSGKAANLAVLNPIDLMPDLVGAGTAKVFTILLAVAAFPPACFSSFIAANSFKTTLPKVHPFISCGIGTLASIGLVVSAKAGDAKAVFGIIGASFGPICGAMMADYLLAGRKWPGPRAGFNLAGWISWAAGFVVGANLIPGMAAYNPCPPMAAFVVGLVLYFVLAKAGLQSKTLEMPPGMHTSR
ncbi:MAG: cytosine permease [Pirellulales bacterium]|nr:cytosine permease [Pirellulales bacterium]